MTVRTALAFEGEPDEQQSLFNVPFDPWALKRKIGTVISGLIQELIDWEIKAKQEIDDYVKTQSENDCR